MRRAYKSPDELVKRACISSFCLQSRNAVIVNLQGRNVKVRIFLLYENFIQDKTK